MYNKILHFQNRELEESFVLNDIFSANCLNIERRSWLQRLKFSSNKCIEDPINSIPKNLQLCGSRQDLSDLKSPPTLSSKTAHCSSLKKKKTTLGSPHSLSLLPNQYRRYPDVCQDLSLSFSFTSKGGLVSKPVGKTVFQPTREMVYGYQGNVTPGKYPRN